MHNFIVLILHDIMCTSNLTVQNTLDQYFANIHDVLAKQFVPNTDNYSKSIK